MEIMYLLQKQYLRNFGVLLTSLSKAPNGASSRDWSALGPEHSPWCSTFLAAVVKPPGGLSYARRSAGPARGA